MNQGKKRKWTSKWILLTILGAMLFFVVACGNGNEESQGEGSDNLEGPYIQKADLSMETNRVLALLDNSGEWIYQYQIPTGSEIRVDLEYYENGEYIEGPELGPDLSGYMGGEGMIAVDYDNDEGRLSMSAVYENQNQGFSKGVSDLPAPGYRTLTIYEPINLEPGKQYIGGIIYNEDHEMYGEGIANEEEVETIIEENDYVYLFVVEYSD